VIWIAANSLQGTNIHKQVRMSFEAEPTEKIFLNAFCQKYDVARKAIGYVQIFDAHFGAYFDLNPEETLPHGSRINIHMMTTVIIN
jgi:hypothetical protein